MTKRVILVLPLLFVLGMTATAVELDFATTGQMTLLEGDQQFSGSGTATIVHRFSQDHRITAEALGTLSTGVDPNAFLTLLEYRGVFPLASNTGIVTLTAGRIVLAELSGLFTPLTLDGFIVGLQVPGFIVQAAATTTALFRPEESLILTTADETDAADPARFFGPPRAVAALVLFFPETISTLNISLQYITQLDGRLVLGADPGDDLYSSHYVTLGVESPLGPELFGSVFLIGNYGALEVRGVGRSHLIGYGGRAQLRSYLPAAGRPTGLLSVYFASGDGNPGGFPAFSNDVSTSFAPGPYEVPWTFTGVPFANVLAGELSGTLLPLSWADDPGLRRTQISGATTLLYRPFAEDMGVSGVDPAAGSGIYGVLLNAGVVFAPFTDLELEAAGDIFLPVQSENGGLFLPGAERTWRFQLEGTLRF